MLLAVALSESKKPGEAVEAFALAERQYAASQREALDAKFYLTYGAAAERAGLLEKAAALLQKSITLDPDNAAEALNYLGYMWIDRNVNLEQAGAFIRRALTLRPNHPAYLDSLGWWYYRKGDFTAAVQELRHALENMRREDAGEVYDHLGDALEKLSKPEEALAAWEAALEMDATLAGPREKIARVRAETGAQPAP
jgi:tetratricopeptide (TPR) repeat protein